MALLIVMSVLLLRPHCSVTITGSDDYPTEPLNLQVFSASLAPPSTKLYPEIYDSKNFLALSSARTADAARQPTPLIDV